MKKTGWFPAGTKPVHKGAYECRMFVIEDRFGTGGVEYGVAFWNGEYWGLMYSKLTVSVPYGIRGSQFKEWRGLAEKPE